ncbi:MAG TPA: CHAT domain-containing tetratricopeptide repeat protein [Candidatus Polarisedimenticolia bacterium]|jgi:CHAT domain-containing protein|nr:CHAT domain-containing tetratricopeptide repeat protein [Candidatus Polarisedimenticolia bacterium]
MTRAAAACLVFLLIFTSMPAAETTAGAEKTPGRGDEAAHTSEALTLIHAGNYPEAEVAARRRLAEVEAESGPRSLPTAQALDELAEALWRQGKGPDPDSHAIAARALEIKETLLGKEDPRLATSLRPLGIMSNQRGDYSAAVAFFERAVRITERAYGPDDRRVAMNLNNLALELRQVGDYAGARAQAERALAIKRRTEPPGDMLATGLSALAGTLALMGDTKEARRMLEEALAMQEQTLPPDSPSLLLTIDDLANTLVMLGDLDAARPLAERGLRLRESKLGPDHFHVAYSLLGLGHLETLSGNKEAALAYLGRALAVREKAFGPAHPWVASTLLLRGEARDTFGDPQGAREDYERALRIQDQTLDARHPDRAQTILNLSKVLLELGDRGPAFDRGLEAARASGEHFRATAQVMSQSDALRYALERSDALDVPLSILVVPGAAKTPPGDTTRVWDQVMRSRAMVLDEMASRHRDVSGQGGGDVSRRTMALTAARSYLAAALVKVPAADGLQAYREQLTRLYAEKESAERSLAEASAPFRRQQTRSRAGFEEVFRNLPEGSTLLAYVQFGQRSAAQRTPTPSYAAFVARAGRKEAMLIPLGKAFEIDPLVQAWQREAGTDPRREGSVAAAGERYRHAGEGLRRRIWDPVASRIGKPSILLIVPDGSLNLVNFATLPLADGRFLLEEGPVMHFLSSERDVVPVPSAAGLHEGVLAIGGVDYDAFPTVVASAGPAAEVATPDEDAVATHYRSPDSGCDELRELRFSPLPATSSEVEAVSASAASQAAASRPPHTGASGVRKLVGSAASETAFKAEAERYGTLHLATHAYFVNDRCGPGAAGGPVEASEGGGRAPKPQPALEDPLLWSGLALAGANLRRDPATGVAGDDGLLTAEEIASLDLSGVRWAVLSACRTGVGTLRSGEGVLGLRRAFAIAGAGTLITSLWRVEDEATSAWMTALYRARFRGLSSAASVRQAGLDLLTAQRAAGRPVHPFFWGGFIAAGDWR